MPATTALGDDLLASLTDPNVTIVAKLAKAVTDDDSDQFTLASFTEADFPGYAAVPISDWEIVDDDGEIAEGLSPEIDFVASDAIVTPQNIYAVYYVREEVGHDATLFHLELMEFPQVVEFPDDAVIRQLRVTAAPEPS